MTITKTYLTLIALNGLILSAGSVSAATISSEESTEKIAELGREIARLVKIEDRTNLVELAIDRALLAQTANAPQTPRLRTAGVPSAKPIQDDKDPTETNDLKTQNDNKELPDDEIPTRVGLIAVPKVKMPTIGRIEHKSPATAATIDSQPIAQGSSDRHAKITRLIKELQTGDKDKQMPALIALEDMKADAKSIVPQLIPLLKSKNSNVRISAISALTTMEDAAKSAIPQLLSMIKDPDPIVSLGAATAISIMAPLDPDVVPKLVNFLKDPNPIVRSYTAYALGAIGYSANYSDKRLTPSYLAKVAVPQLIITLKDRDAGVRAQVVEALGQIGSGSSSSTPQLILRLKDKDPLVRRKTVLALGQIGETAKSAIPSLVPLLKDPNLKGDVRSLLEKLGYKAK